LVSDDSEGDETQAGKFSERAIADAEIRFVRDLELANSGTDVIEITQALNAIDKRLCSLAFNRAKKFLVSKSLLDADRFGKGGYGGMNRKDRRCFIDTLCAVPPQVLAELKQIMLPPSSKYPEVQQLLKDTNQIYQAQIISPGLINAAAAAAAMGSILPNSTSSEPMKVEQPPPVPVVPNNDTSNHTATQNIGKKKRSADSMLASTSSFISVTPVEESLGGNNINNNNNNNNSNAAVNVANVELIRQKVLQIKAQRLADAMNDPSFKMLPIETQDEIKSSYVSAVLGN